jgi:ribosomal protein S27AE
MDAIELRVAQLDDDTKKLREQAIAQGYKDDICPKCSTVLLAHHHFVACNYARTNNCPMSNNTSLLDMLLGSESE